MYYYGNYHPEYNFCRSFWIIPAKAINRDENGWDSHNRHNKLIHMRLHKLAPFMITSIWLFLLLAAVFTIVCSFSILCSKERERNLLWYSHTSVRTIDVIHLSQRYLHALFVTYSAHITISSQFRRVNWIQLTIVAVILRVCLL